jgi:hypothetical protein
MAATRALLVDLITINNMCGGRMTVEEALRFKRLEDMTFDEEYRMMNCHAPSYEGKEFRSLEECGVTIDESGVLSGYDKFDESGVRNDVLDAWGI